MHAIQRLVSMLLAYTNMKKEITDIRFPLGLLKRTFCVEVEKLKTSWALKYYEQAQETQIFQRLLIYLTNYYKQKSKNGFFE